MATAYLGLGANLGDPDVQIEDAIARLTAHQTVRLVKRSAIIGSAPWGKTDQPAFRNIVIAVETTLPPLLLLDLCLNTEAEMGRERIEHWGPRNIDIDIIVYERKVIKTERLTLPHPFATERDFVMDPLAEIAPEVANWLRTRPTIHTPLT